MDPEKLPYYHLTGKSRLDKSINTLLGILEGVTLDQIVSTREKESIREWLEENRELQGLHPYNEITPLLQEVMAAGIVSLNQKEDLCWMCKNLLSSEYYDGVTADMQRLQGLLAGIIADGIITVPELRGLAKWQEFNSQLARCWPYDEITSLITKILQDGKIDAEEHALFSRFISEFVSPGSFILDRERPRPNTPNITGICAVCPEISFEGHLFCFTGECEKFPRVELFAKVVALGGNVTDSLRRDVDYLVVCTAGNPCYAYCCYGRKVERAMDLRRRGSPVMLVHESDFFDAIADLE